ncbi:MAG: cytochrome c oxidase subunit II [Candidatus Dormibacteria bacterium]
MTARLDSLTFPAPVSPNGQHLFDLYNVISYIAIVVFVLMEAAIIFTAIRWRRRSQDEWPKQNHGNTRLEIVWTIIPAVIIAIISVLSGVVLFQDNTPASVDMSVKVRGTQFVWIYEYPAYGVRTAGTLYAPVNQTVQLTLSSPDVIHSWWVPELNGKKDAVPGYLNYTWFKAERTGTFKGECAEFCGINHAEMLITVQVLDPQAFQSWTQTCVAQQLCTALPKTQ